MNKYIIFIFSIFTMSPCLAQEKIKGLVLTDEGKAIQGASVEIAVPNNKQTLQTRTTEADGRFVFESTPEKFSLSVSVFGYKRYSHIMTADSVANTPLIIHLEPLSIGEVVVKGNGRPRMTREGNKLVIDNISRSFYAKGSDAFTFFRFIPLIDVPTIDGEIKLNEAGGKPVEILENGKPLNVPANVYLKTLRATNIERMEVVAHPMGEYRVSGDRAVINIILKKREQGIWYNLYLSDTQNYHNSADGNFNLTYTRGKWSMAAGTYSNYRNNRIDRSAEYRFTPLNRMNNDHYKNDNSFFGSTVFLNVDYTLNKKSWLGVRFGVNAYKTKDKSLTSTVYKPISSESVDSIYQSQIEARTPFNLQSLSTNLNYSLRLNEKGSMFFADFDYRLSKPQSSTTYNFDKNAASSFLYNQNARSKAHGFSTWLRYNAVFSKATRMNLSLLFLTGSSDNNSYSNMRSLDQSTHFNDYNLIATGGLSHEIADKLYLSMTLNFNAYWSRMKEKLQHEIFNRNTILVPTLYVKYTPNNNHNLTLTAEKSYYVPRYSDLDPTRLYMSPNTYSSGNMNLKPSETYYVYLTYTYKNGYGLRFYFQYINNVGNTYITTDGKGNAIIGGLNDVSLRSGDIQIFGGQSLLNNYLYLYGEFSVGMSNSTNRMNGTNNRNFNRNIFTKFKCNVTLSKKQRLFLYSTCSYASKSVGVNGVYSGRVFADVSITKNFNNSNLSFSISRALREYAEQYSNTPNFYFLWRTKQYWWANIRYSISFGKGKVRGVESRENSDLRNRLDRY